ncbi:MAG: UDP-3-O-acyl-N-acetylglucosamine deacetylase [Fimbriimonadaceae bacterium]|nr:UDP-3-O-acyl-N-acetylglucosamine deacetylase [Fimbriimonadaceae bacterium]
MNVERKTVAGDFRVKGLGLHSGIPVEVRVAPGDGGIAFWQGGTRTPAIPANVADTTRCTRLGPVSTIEHLMAAFAGLGVTDAEVELDAPELPALDGAARVWVDEISAVGFTDLDPRELPSLYTRIYEKNDPVTVAISHGTGDWKYIFDTGERWPGRQTFEFHTDRDSFADEVAPARTLVFEEEIEMARAAGLGQGLDETTVLALGNSGYINEAKFPDEPARHKLLDLMGDLYLAGVPLRFLNVVAERSGHTANVRAAAKLWEAVHG